MSQITYGPTGAASFPILSFQATMILFFIYIYIRTLFSIYIFKIEEIRLEFGPMAKYNCTVQFT